MRIPAERRCRTFPMGLAVTLLGATPRGLGALPMVIAAGLGLAAVSLGCNKKDSAPRPAALPASPASPASPAAPASPPSLPGSNGGPGPTAAPSLAPGASPTVVGRIVLAPARKGDVTPTDVVYLIARRVPDNPGARGALVAVKRFTAASFPIDFTLGAGDMMFKNGAFEGDLALAARVDKDGDPMTRRKGDVFGTLERVRVGETGVEINLDQLQKQDESLAGAPPAGGMPSGHP